MSERVYSKYGSKHATTIVASIIESVEDNLLHGMRVGCACGVCRCAQVMTYICGEMYVCLRACACARG